MWVAVDPSSVEDQNENLQGSKESDGGNIKESAAKLSAIGQLEYVPDKWHNTTELEL